MQEGMPGGSCGRRGLFYTFSAYCRFSMSNPTLYDRIVNMRVMRIVFFIAALLFVLYQCDVNPRMDDDFLGEQAYWTAKAGVTKSELMRGYGGIGQENYQAVFHKLLVYHGAIMIKLFGWSAGSLHLVNFLHLGLFLLIFYRFIRQRFPDEPALSFAAVTILFLNHEFAYGSGSFRPEIMIMTLGFGSYYALDTYLKKERGSYGWLLLAALLSSLCFLTHLNGMIFIVAGFVLLLRHKRYLQAILFGAVSSISFFGLYLADVLAHADIPFLIFQFRHDPALSGDDFSWYAPLVKLWAEQARFLYNEKEVPFTLALLAALIFGYRYLKQRLGHLLLFVLTLILTLALYTYSKTPQYLIIYGPYFTLIFLQGWKAVEANGKAYQKWILRVLTLAFVTINLGYVVLRDMQNIKAYSQDSVTEINHKLAMRIPEVHSLTDVLAPNDFVFNELDSFRRIQSMGKYNFYRTFHNQPLPTFNALLDSARKYEIRYVIFSPEDVDKFGVRRELQAPAGRFRLLGEEGGRMIIGLNPAINGTSAPR